MSGAPANIFEQQAANRRNTVVVMAVFVLFVAFLGLGFDVFFLGYDPGGRGLFGFPVATLAAILIGAFSAYNGLESGARTVLASSGAVPAAADDPRYTQLHNVVEEMAIAAGIPPPAVYVIPDPDPNAFATGKDPEHACIAVTQGLLDSLNRDELQGVVAHEMGHVRNYDIRLMTVIAALIGAVMLLAQFGSRTARFGTGGRRSRSGGGGGGVVLLVLWLIALVLAPFISKVLAMAVSRQREYLADASGAQLTRNPAALASALQKIDAAVEPTRSIKQGTAHLCIANPLGSNLDGKEGFFADLFSTHPPIQKRIMLLKAMAYQHA
ncbi:MAG TPA: M48 family metallopeptidase [Bacteroidota bacterium]|nr:M48 family metallopeptidase [Bacteroidota bacterium]